MNLIFPVRRRSKSASGIHFNLLHPHATPAYLSRGDKKDFFGILRVNPLPKVCHAVDHKSKRRYTFPHPPTLDALRAV